MFHLENAPPVQGKSPQVLQKAQNSSAQSDSQRIKGSCSHFDLSRKHERRGESQAFGAITRADGQSAH